MGKRRQRFTSPSYLGSFPLHNDYIRINYWLYHHTPAGAKKPVQYLATAAVDEQQPGGAQRFFCSTLQRRSFSEEVTLDGELAWSLARMTSGWGGRTAARSTAGYAEPENWLNSRRNAKLKEGFVLVQIGYIDLKRDQFSNVTTQLTWVLHQQLVFQRASTKTYHHPNYTHVVLWDEHWGGSWEEGESTSAGRVQVNVLEKMSESIIDVLGTVKSDPQKALSKYQTIKPEWIKMQDIYHRADAAYDLLEASLAQVLLEV